jgi:glc operon protein GlcG
MTGIDTRYSITGAKALEILTRIYEKANAMGKPVFIAVVDGSGALMGLLAHEKVPAICRQICQDKAFTAHATRMKTSLWKSYVYSTPQEERDLMLRQPGYIAASGGCPILVNGVVAGAVGVSGAGQQEDEDLAEFGAGLAAAL